MIFGVVLPIWVVIPNLEEFWAGSQYPTFKFSWSSGLVTVLFVLPPLPPDLGRRHPPQHCRTSKDHVHLYLSDSSPPYRGRTSMHLHLSDAPPPWR